MAFNYKKYFFWLYELKKIVWEPFWWVFCIIIVLWLPFLRPWWWIFVPLFMCMELRTLYLWWVAWDFEYASRVKWVMLEIIPPKEILVPLKAMEDILSLMWNPLFDTANFREVWCSGELNDTPYWMSFEIVSIEGSIHFYARVMAQHRTYLESSLYSHYPELEIQEVPDYVKNVPQSIPNDEYNLYGEEFIAVSPAPFSIKTYEKFFEPQGEKISAEEKRIDPVNSLLESMSRLGQGEQYWTQFIFSATNDRYDPDFIKEAAEMVAKITRRPVKKQKSFLGEIMEVFHMIVFGPQQEGSGEDATYKWAESAERSETGEREMLLTPGERETLLEIETKLKKPIFRTTVRGLYIAKRENWKASHGKLLRSYMGHFNTSNTILMFDSATRTKVHYLFRKRRVFLRGRRMVRNAVLRFPPYFPDRRKGFIFLTVEELATLFHFPFKVTSLALPTVERVEHRKGGPPPNLPIG